MGRPFDVDGARIRVRLGAPERQLLARLLDEVGELLDDGSSPGADPLAELVGFDPIFPDGPISDGGLPGRLVPAPVPSAAPGSPPRPAAPAGEGDPANSANSANSADGTDQNGTGPGDDPALARLLPSAHRDDPVLAAEFRWLTEAGLRARKRSSLSLASAALRRHGEVALTREEASALLKGLTDTRLVLGERLGLRTDEDAENLMAALHQHAGREDPWVSAALLYDALTWWQESLVLALSR